MIEFISQSQYDITGRGKVFGVANPRACGNFNWLLNQRVKIDGREWLVTGIERFAIGGTYPEGKPIGLLVKEVPGVEDGLTLMGNGFIGARYRELYPDTALEPRNGLVPSRKDVLYSISTVHNYHAADGDLERDIDTNLRHLVRVLPNVCGTFTFLSSWFTYAGGRPSTPQEPARETDNGRPIGFYSASKLCAELLVESYCRSNNIPFRILRLGNVIGGDPKADKRKNALEWMINRVAAGEDVDLYTGDNYRNVSFVDDICRGIHLAIERGDINTIYNVGNTHSARMFDLIQHAKTITGSNSRINLIAPPRFHSTIQTSDFWLDTTKLRSLGFTPDMNPYQAVERVLANL